MRPSVECAGSRLAHGLATSQAHVAYVAVKTSRDQLIDGGGVAVGLDKVGGQGKPARHIAAHRRDLPLQHHVAARLVTVDVRGHARAQHERVAIGRQVHVRLVGAVVPKTDPVRARQSGLAELRRPAAAPASEEGTAVKC